MVTTTLQKNGVMGLQIAVTFVYKRKIVSLSTPVIQNTTLKMRMRVVVRMIPILLTFLALASRKSLAASSGDIGLNGEQQTPSLLSSSIIGLTAEDHFLPASCKITFFSDCRLVSVISS